MMTAEIEKVAIVKDKKGGTVLVGVAKKGDDRVNFKANFDWDTIDHRGFAKDLRERLAQDLDVAFSEMDVLGYKTKFFYICPGAQSTFEHLIEMKPDEDTSGMIRSAAQVADNVFQIEAKVIEDGKATQDQLNQAVILVDDFYDIMEEINEELDMDHDVSYMDGHIEKIQSYL